MASTSFETGMMLAFSSGMTLVGIGLILTVWFGWRTRVDIAAPEGATAMEAPTIDGPTARIAFASEPSLFDDLPDPVVLVDAEGLVLSANRAFLRVFPSSGRPALPRVVETGSVRVDVDGTCRVDEAAVTADGVRWFGWVETERRSLDGTVSRLRCGREITDRLATQRNLDEARERAEAATAAKGRFLATASHEIRTPLAGILGMSDLMLGTPLDPEQTSYVQALRGSAEALGALIEDILDFSRIESGRLDLASAPFELEPLVQDLVELLAPRAFDKGIEVCCFVAASAPRHVSGDRDRLRQILFNLVGNAVKFTSSGGVGISVEGGDGGSVLFTVSDTGPGIAADRLPRIFEEFEQGGLRTTREAGTGLGLAITRRIVERMGGSLGVESTPNAGSTFRLRLPLPAADGPNPVAAPLPSGRTALIVADAPFEGNFLARRLGERGIRTLRAASVLDGVAAIGRGGVDMVIVDGSLGEAGIRLLGEIARAAGTARTLVLLSPGERRLLGPHRDAGYDAYLTKPVRSRSLFERLDHAAETGPARSPAASSAPPTPRLGLTRVLLAEDSEINALLALKNLEKLGARVDWARTGREALERAEAALDGRAPPYDLVLIDMRMPEMDGFEVTRRIREAEAASGREERMRIVALTASLHGHESRLRETAGFDGFLAKPFSVAAVAGYLGREVDIPLAAAS